MTVNKLQTLLNDEYRRDIGHTMVEDDGVFLPIHDADGNQTLIKTKTGIWSVTYNGENRPVLWTCGTTNIVMKFDRMGRRVEYIEQDGLITNKHQKFVYDGYLCIQRLNGANNSITELFEWDPTEPVATRPMFMQYRVPGQTYALFYTHDGNKNVSEVVHFSRANGVAAHYEYAPFGETIVKDRQGGILAYDFADINPWRFSSEYADEMSGTVYYVLRHYVTTLGKWNARDPAEEEFGINLMQFIGNSALHGFDRLGLAETFGCTKSEAEVSANIPLDKNLITFGELDLSYLKTINYTRCFRRCDDCSLGYTIQKIETDSGGMNATWSIPVPNSLSPLTIPVSISFSVSGGNIYTYDSCTQHESDKGCHKFTISVSLGAKIGIGKIISYSLSGGISYVVSDCEGENTNWKMDGSIILSQCYWGQCLSMNFLP